MSNQEELIAQFVEISGGDENLAKFYLSSSNWSLQDALSNFLGHQSDNEAAPPAEDVTGTPSPTDVPPTHSTGSRETAAKAEDKPFGKKSAAKPKFGTLRDMAQESPDDEEEGQAFYAGGSERSGQQVLGPPKRKNFREQLTDMFRMAHEHGSSEESVEPSTSTGTTWGQGVRLGMTDSDHTVVTPLNKINEAGGDKKPVVVLKLWSQGFSINDGELRSYDDPDNKEFLETVMRGEIPQELLQMGWMVNVDVEDHRHEDFKKTATVTRTFKGSGHTLGSPAPNIVADIPQPRVAATSASSAEPAADEKVAKEKLNLNAAAPTTTLQIRLADGSRLAAQFNLTHTIGDIQQYIIHARPQYADRNFLLVSSFPTRELSDDAATIEAAGLKNASIMQRLV